MIISKVLDSLIVIIYQTKDSGLIPNFVTSHTL